MLSLLLSTIKREIQKGVGLDLGRIALSGEEVQITRQSKFVVSAIDSAHAILHDVWGRTSPG